MRRKSKQSPAHLKRLLPPELTSTGRLKGFALVEAGLIMAQAGLLALMLAGLAEGHMAPWLGPAFLLLVMGRTWMGGQLQRQGQQAAARVRASLRQRLDQQLEAQGLGRLRQCSPADWSHLYRHQTHLVAQYVANYLPARQLATLVPLCLTAAVGLLMPLAGLVLLVFLLLCPLCMALVGIWLSRSTQQQRAALGQLNGLFHNRVSGLDTVLQFDALDAQTEQMQARSRAFSRHTLDLLKKAFINHLALDMLAVGLVLAVALLVTSAPPPTDPATLAISLCVLALSPELFGPIRNLSRYYHDKQLAELAAEALLQQLEGDAPVPASPPQVSVTPGEKLLLRGPSGCGKTTLLQQMAGLFSAPDAPAVTVTALASPDMPLLSGSLRENLDPAGQHEDQRLMQAIQAMELDGLVPNVATLDLAVGEGGRGLSGGQAQRLALARVWLQTADWVLLDEPDAHLPPVQAKRLTERLLSRHAGATIVVASHGLDDMARAFDRTLTLKIPALASNAGVCT
jgi:ATP-binding cassette subfamily C protein CydD